MAALLLASSLRQDHVRTAADYGSTSRRACPCCISLVPRSKDATRARRAQRRRENNAFRAGREDI